MTFLMSISSARRTALLAAALGATTLLGACAPLVVGGAMVGGAMSFTDRLAPEDSSRTPFAAHQAAAPFTC